MKNIRLMTGRPLSRSAAAIASKWTRHRLLRNVAVVVGLGGALLGGIAGVAQASQVLNQNQSHSFSTRFWGRTEVCFTDVSPQYDASYLWVSATTVGGGGLMPNSTSCVARSFLGFDIKVTNVSAGPAQIDVTFPIGE